MVIERAPLEDEVGDVLDKALRRAGLSEGELAARSHVDEGRVRDALDYREDFTPEELGRVAAVLGLNPVGLAAVASGRYPMPTIGGLPFCLYPLRTPHGIGVANAYLVASCTQSAGVLFDAGSSAEALRRAWPAAIQRVEAVFITHPEAEHLGGLEAVRERCGSVPVFGPGGRLPGASMLADGARLTVGQFEVEALRTPGHAEAHNCYVVRAAGAPRSRPLLVSGDLIFAGSIGGAYFCHRELGASVRRVLAGLPPETVIAPGHGPLTTLANEIAFNPFLSA